MYYVVKYFAGSVVYPSLFTVFSLCQFVIRLIMKVENISESEAAKRLEEIELRI